MKKYSLKEAIEKSHIQLAFAIKELYIDKKILSQEYYENFIQALDLREMADYKRKFSKAGAQKIISSAEEAIKLVERVIGKRLRNSGFTSHYGKQK